ncbi:MAG: hypothetical protein N2249_01985 [Melioribacter sp.]|nr:hypothetical protein [Melioribacter sp.]
MIKKFLYIIFLFIVVSCDIFTTRTPEEPDTPSSNFIAATSPEILFRNFKSSIEEKIIENYLACFVDTSYLKRKFVFIPASGAVSQYPVLNNWTINEEKQYFLNLISKLPSGKNVTLTLENFQSNFFSDSAFYSVDYSLKINSNNQFIGGTFVGSSQFKIYIDSRKQWSIVEWQDIRKGNFQCWSDLKGRTAY